VQAVAVPIWRRPEDRAAVLAHLDRVRAALKDRVRLLVDDREQYTPGWKYYEHELRGVPVRLEVGPKDVEKQAVMSVRRDNRGKEPIPLDRLAERLPALLEEVQASLFRAALEFRARNTTTATTLEDLVRHFQDEGKRGFVAVPWNGSTALEADIKDQCAATLRCIPLDQSPFQGLAPAGQRVALFARAY
jgi:prolyl-tRNA synthetase